MYWKGIFGIDRLVFERVDEIGGISSRTGMLDEFVSDMSGREASLIPTSYGPRSAFGCRAYRCLTSVVTSSTICMSLGLWCKKRNGLLIDLTAR